MSYCRWTTDSDIYMFYHMDEYFSIHIAQSRTRNPTNTESLIASLKDSIPEINLHPRRIGLAYDGQHFACDTAQEALDTLLMLKREGYLVPDHAIQRLRADIARE